MTANLKAPKINKVKGLTLIELLIAMAISAILIAAIYRTFIGQQKTYTVQEQVADMQQNVRVAINKMMREIRMAGFGNVSSVLPIITIDGTFNNIINPSNGKDNIKGQYDDQITIIGAFEKVSTLATEHAIGTNIIQLSDLPKNALDLINRKYICIGGLESHTITNVDASTSTITLSDNVVNNFTVGTPVYKVKAITYRLRPDNSNPYMPVLTREDNTDGGGSQVVAENIENLQFRYILKDGTETDLPAAVDCPNIRMVRVTVNARTSMSDPEFKGGTAGFRRRTIASNIQVRNMGLNP
jgi:prepilin-type N-terminal cleavage/methylation domain-containing protein